jgi:hypothetical protein
MADKGVKYVLTGHCGPNAHETLSAAGIGVVPGCSGTVRDAVQRFKAGQLSTSDEPTVASHFGVGETQPRSQGQPLPPRDVPVADGGIGTGRRRGGGGRGMGRGRGQGRGRGGGMGRGRSSGTGAWGD